MASVADRVSSKASLGMRAEAVGQQTLVDLVVYVACLGSVFRRNSE